MLKVMTTTLLLVVLTVLPSVASAAGVVPGAGAKFTWDDYRNSVLDYSNQPTGASFTLNDTPAPRFGGEIQLGLMDRRLVLMIPVDFSIAKHKVFPYVDGNSEVESTAKFFNLGIGAGGKFFLKPPSVKAASPYLALTLGKVFAKVSADPVRDAAGNEVIKSELKVLSKLSSPFYFRLAFGAEFFVADTFSVGADIFGISFEIAKAKGGQAKAGDDHFLSGDHTALQMNIYSALTINFGWPKDGAAKAAPADNGWGTTPAPVPAPAPTGNSWGTTPAPVPAPAPTGNSWGTTPAPVPAPAPAPAGNVGPVYGTAPAPAPAPTEEIEPLPTPKKKTPRKKRSDSGAAAPPPPPAP